MFDFLRGLFGSGKPRILIADDDDNVRSLVSYLLTAHGYRVTEAVDGQDALDKFKPGRFVLIVLDLHMPRMDGLQALKMLRTLPGGPEQPVIMLTSDQMVENSSEAFSQKAVAYLAKPFDPAALTRAVSTILHRTPKPAR